jgi:hypothetical protein
MAFRDEYNTDDHPGNKPAMNAVTHTHTLELNANAWNTMSRGVVLLCGANCLRDFLVDLFKAKSPDVRIVARDAGS